MKGVCYQHINPRSVAKFSMIRGVFKNNVLMFVNFSGELYILSTSVPKTTARSGKVYLLVDPGR